MSQYQNRRKIWVSIIAIVLAILMVGGVIFSILPVLVSAASSAELKAQLEDLKDRADEIAAETAALEVEISENESETISVVDQKMNIDQQIELTRQQVENLNQQIQQYNMLIAARQDELDAALAEADEMNETYKLRLRAMEESGDISYWAILFEAKSFTDLLDKIDMITEIAQSDQQMLLKMQENAESIAKAKEEVEANKLALEGAREELAKSEETLAAQRAEADELIVSLALEQDELLAASQLYDEMEAEVRAEILATQKAYEDALADEEAARKIEEARRAAAAAAAASASSSGGGSSGSSGGGGGGGGFMHPLGGYAVVTDAYGYRYHPIYGYYSMHYGVDLAAGQGTPIYAAKSGTVTVATYGSANGNYVTINHNDGYASLYAHMTHYVVGVGDYVNKGDVIGYVGSTGWSSGPHLHFEIFYGGANVNPMQYI